MSGLELHIPLLIKYPERYHIHLCLTVLTPQMTTFLELTIPWVHCQTALGIKLTREYPISLTLHLACQSLPHMMLPISLPMLTGIPLDSDMTQLWAIRIYVAPLIVLIYDFFLFYKTTKASWIHFFVGTWNLVWPKSVFLVHRYSEWFQNKLLFLIPFKMRAAVCAFVIGILTYDFGRTQQFDHSSK